MVELKNYKIIVKDTDGDVKRKFEFYRITKNRFVMEIGRLHNYKFLKDHWFENGMVTIEEEDCEKTDKKGDLREYLRILHNAGYSYSDIAKELDIPESAVRDVTK